MAMEIKVNGNAYKADYEERLQAGREKAVKAGGAQEEERAQKAGNASEKAQGQKPAQQDAYISSEASGGKPNGLYYVGQDENGSKKVYFNDPKKREKAEDPDNGEEKCVGNTDQVDREIRELKEKKQKLEQQIKEASGDEQKTKELESKLAQIERELSQKDNDTYRRSHSRFTEE